MVDIAGFTYVIELVEEQGLTGYPWSLVMKQPVRLATTVGFASPHGTGYDVDGVVVNAGDRVLVKDSVYASQVMVAVTSASWIPAADFTAPSDFTQGVVVPVALGVTQGGSLWQTASNQTSWSGSGGTPLLTWVARGPDDDETALNMATEFFGHGNVWCAAAVSYTGITQESPE